MAGFRRFGVKLGNDRFAALLRMLGNPHRRYDVVHVTGTKGKGSTTAMVASILRCQGYRVGGYFSPYVYDVRERVTVDGEMISREEMADLITRLAPCVEKLAAAPDGQTTEFELKTAVGFSYFADKAVDLAAVEVGLGGRLDATNVVLPLVSVITNVGLDHTDVLGPTHAAIANEKAGIIKEGVPVVTAVDVPEARCVVERVAAVRDARVVQVAPASSGQAESGWTVTWRHTSSGLAVRTPRGCYEGLRTALKGEFQGANAACAIAAVEEVAYARGFVLAPDAVSAGLASALLPGRMAVLRRDPIVLADGAHNGLAASALATEVVRLGYDRLLLVVGMLRGHDPKDVLGPLAPMASSVYVTRPTWFRALPSEELADVARSFCRDVRVVEPPREAALAALAEARPSDLVLITGSFYTVGDVPPETVTHKAV